jgi:hypothetical protein
MRNFLKKFPWLRIIYSLLAITVVNLILAYHFLTPPVEHEPTTFWPIVFYSKLIIPLTLFLPAGFLFTIAVSLLRKKWMEAFASLLVMLIVTYFSFGLLLFSGTFELVDSLKMEDEIVHLATISDLEGGSYFALCSEKEGKGICDYFFSEYPSLPNRAPELNNEPSTKNITVSLQEITIYKYDGNFPGRCIVASETLRAESISGDCGSYYHGGK